MTDKKTISVIETISEKVNDLKVEQGKLAVKINIVMWVLGAILVAGLPGVGFLIAYWIQNQK